MRIKGYLNTSFYLTMYLCKFTAYNVILQKYSIQRWQFLVSVQKYAICKYLKYEISVEIIKKKKSLKYLTVKCIVTVDKFI